jgi:kynurenine formamidase
MNFAKKLGAAAVAVVVLSTATVAGAVFKEKITISGVGGGAASMKCPGGMTRLGHPFANDMTIFEFDPAVHIEDEYTVAVDFFQVEDIDTGSHAGTHLDAPSHFIEGARSVDQLAAEEFLWPVYKIDVRDMTFNDGLIEAADIEAYEDEHGKIPEEGALVVLQTGAEEFWGAEVVAQDEDDNAANADDFFDFEAPGFSGAAVQWLFDERDIAGVGSDAYGPDAYSDANFDATFTTLLNDGVALVGIANLDSVSVRGDIIFASTVALQNGSGFSTDPIACHAKP